MQRLGTKWFCISDFSWRRWSGAPPLDRLPAKAEGARSIHRWLRMHRPLTSFSPPAEAVYRGVATVIPNSFLGARCESWVLGEDQCSRPSKGMLLSGLQRYYLSPDTPCTPRYSSTVPFRERNGGKSKSLKVGVWGSQKAPGGLQRQHPWWRPGGKIPWSWRLFLILRYETPISWHFILFQTATHKILFTVLWGILPEEQTRQCPWWGSGGKAPWSWTGAEDFF